MGKGLQIVRRLALVLAVIAALVGWAAALVANSHVTDLEERLVMVEAELSQTTAALGQKSDELAKLQFDLLVYEDMSVKLGAVTKDVADTRAELTGLVLQIETAEAQLERVRVEVSEQQALLTGTARNYVTTTRAKVRARPTTASQEIAIVPSGTRLRVYETVEGGTWHKVGSVGFMYHELLKPVAG